MTNEIIGKQQEDMISMIMEGQNISSIARKLNVARGTVYSWLNKEVIKAELEKRRHEIATQGNNYILKDTKSYIDNIKALAKDKSDKRVCLAANQYLLNRIYGNPTAFVESNDDNADNGIDTNELELELAKFKKISRIK